MSNRQLISTGSPFEKVAGYSRAVRVGNMVYVAGTTGYDYETMTLPEGVTEQARNCMETIKKALAEAASKAADPPKGQDGKAANKSTNQGKAAKGGKKKGGKKKKKGKQ